MKTPKEYTQNLKNGIITAEMLSDCIFSCNKRAKNWRDKEAQLHRYFAENRFATDNHDNEFKAMMEKDKYYGFKDELLRLLKPVCIHVETRINYFYLPEGKEPWNPMAKKTGHTRYLAYEYEEESKKYYLFYKCAGHSFHSPIDSPDQYPDLPVVELKDKLETYGKDTLNLLSMQFVSKVLDLIRSGNYTFLNESEKDQDAKPE